MPTYLFKSNNTGEIVEHVLNMSQYDVFMADNPDLQRYYNSENMGALIRGINVKPASGFREVLKTIKGKHRNSTINDF